VVLVLLCACWWLFFVRAAGSALCVLLALLNANAEHVL
jgi:hypothetical protein